MTPCGCRVVRGDGSIGINGGVGSPIRGAIVDYCPLHAAAEDMLAALIQTHGTIFHDDGRVCCAPSPGMILEPDWHCPYALLIEKASGVAHHCHCHEGALIARAEGR